MQWEYYRATLQAMLRGAGPVGYCLKVLKGILLAGRFVPRHWFLVPGCCACCLRGVLFLGVAITGTGSIGSPRQLAPGVLVLGHCGY